MKITYIAHSGFLAEFDSVTLLFDYYKGTLPSFSASKPLIVFASHQHADHFNPAIFDLAGQYPLVTYVLSHDIWTCRRKYLRQGISEEAFEKAIILRAHEKRILPCKEETLTVRTLRSTDQGVAFLIECEGMRIYHAGDLNWWLWEGDTKQEAGNMTANFKREIASLAGLSLDLAFIPLDPRQGDYYYLGMKYLLETANILHTFPMHFWDDYSVTERFSAQFSHTAGKTHLHVIHREGESWTL